MKLWAVAVAVAAFGSALSGCGGAAASLGQQVSTWGRDSGFMAALATIRSDLARLAVASPTSSALVRTECDVLVTDSLAAHQQLPTPDAMLTSLLGNAYASAGSSGSDCFSAASGHLGVLERSATERAQAVTWLIKAEARFDALIATVPTSP